MQPLQVRHEHWRAGAAQQPAMATPMAMVTATAMATAMAMVERRQVLPALA